MKEVRLIRVEKTYPAAGQRHAVHAVRGVDLTIAPGEFFVLLGASGSGKTTLLRCIAGLEETTGGEISIGDTVVASARHTVPALKRNIGMVFQDYAIWPHMTVAENVGFALRHARSGAMRGEAARTRVAEVLDVVGLSTMADRGATYLSGGQQQRVALARAVVAKPDVLLFDEPLSNLDARLRSLMRTELRRIATELGITSVYVTHDQVEALVMADHIAVMKDGLVVQVGTPQEIYRQPNNTFVAGFIGEANLVKGTVVESIAGAAEPYVVVDTELGRMFATPSEPLRPPETVTLVIRPECLHLGDHHVVTSTMPANAVSGIVESATFAGAHTELVLSCSGVRLHAQVHSFEPVDVGSEITVHFSARWTTAIADGVRAVELEATNAVPESA
ncbi:MAG: iron(III) transport system ATP-binding protein [Pseudonocardiales bacterium]|nr:iron(III) transport system ATP-binding protein [Pseudonocardiales bacterium]